MGIYRKLMKKSTSEYDNVPESYWKDAFLKKTASILRGTVVKHKFAKKGKMFCCGKGFLISNGKYISIGDKVIFGRFIKIQGYSKEGISIGDRTQIGDFTVINGTSMPTDIGQGLSIGHDCAFGEYCYFGCAGGIKIGNGVIAGQNIRFHAENHEYKDVNTPIVKQGVIRKGITVGDNCWIGAGVTFLDGAEVGNGCVIGANTLVNHKYPDNSVIVGTPGRIVKTRGK